MPDAIHIRYVRSGGFGGLRAVADVDTNKLAESDPSQAQQLAELGRAVFKEKAPAPPKNARNDGYQYQVAIDYDGKRKSFSAWEPVSSAALQQLIALLDELATISR